MKLGASKISVSLLIICLAITGLSLVSTATAQSDYIPPVSKNLISYVNYPGSGYITPSGLNNYYYGATVTVVAYTYPGCSFQGWYLNGAYMGKLSTITIVMTQDYNLYAVFSNRTSVLSISSNPSQGGSTNPGAGIWCYNYSSDVTVTEYPASGNTFSGWYVDGVFDGTGSSITLKMNQDHQLSAFFAGNGSNPTPTPPAPTPTSSPTPNLPVPSLSFYCASSTTVSGFNVQIQGALSINGTGLSGAGVTFSYSATGGATWHDLAYVITNDYGDFSAVWMPTASGNYIVKGVWLSDGIYSTASMAVNFSVEPSPSQNVFSVASNSTLSSLTFDSTQNKLAFSVSGPSGTMGYLQACIPKSLLTDASTLKISLDGVDVPYSTFSQGNTWLITIQYHHSTHSVVMTLDAPAATSTPTSNPTQTSNPTANTTPTPTDVPTATPILSTPELSPIVMAPLIVMMVGLAVFFVFKKRQKSSPAE